MILSKAAAAVIMELLDVVLICLIVGVKAEILPVFLLLHLLASLSLVPVGGIIGIFVKDKNAANIYSTPVAFFMMLAPMLLLAGSSAAQVFNRLIPSTLVTEVMWPMSLGQTVTWPDFLFSLMITLVWMFAGTAIFFILLRKNGCNIQVSEMK